MKKEIEGYVKNIFEAAEKWRIEAWREMGEANTPTLKRKAAADWNRAIAISGKAAEVLNRGKENAEQK